MTKAEERANLAYPEDIIDASPLAAYPNWIDRNLPFREGFVKGYEQAEKDIITIVKEYVEKGFRCMEQSDKFQMHTFWDGFHNCAENTLREIEDRNE